MDIKRKLRAISSLGSRLFLSTSDSLDAPDRKRQSRLLSSVLLVIIASGIFMEVPYLMPGTDAWGADLLDTLITLGTLLLITGVYVLNRIGFYSESASLSVIIMAAAIFIASYPNASVKEIEMLYYLTIPILFSSILLPVAFNVGFYFILVAGNIGFRYLLPEIETDEFPIVTTTVLCGLSLLAAAHRSRLERDRRAVLEASEERFRTLVNNAPEAILLVEIPGGRIREANRMASLLLERSREELLASDYTSLFLPAGTPGLPEFSASLEKAVSGELPNLEWGLHRRDAPPRLCRAQFVSMPADEGLFVRISITDITAQKRYETRLEHLATHDPLTGLLNRNLFQDRLRSAVARAERAGTSFAVVFLDLDNFKLINDAFDHLSGDALLRELAVRFKLVLRESDSVARLGGDEFTFLLDGDSNQDSGDIVQILERLLRSVSKPMMIYEREISITASLGVSRFPDNGTTPEELLRNADAALQHAKTSGKNTWAFFDGSMTMNALSRLTLGRELRRAMEQDELQLVFQPQVVAVTRTIPALEVLLRWNHPERGILEPDGFIPAAVESGLSSDIDSWMLRRACLQLRGWLDEGLEAVRLTVTLSEVSLRNEHFAGQIEEILSETGIDPQLLELQISEDIVFANVEFPRAFERLRSLNIRFALNGFGTGFSTIRRLTSLPLNILKLDRSFVPGALTSPELRAVVKGIAGIASELGLLTAAEGIDTREEFDAASSCRIDLLQGTYFSPPVTAGECRNLLLSFGSTVVAGQPELS